MATPTSLPVLATPSDFTGFGSNAQLVQTQTVWTPAALTRLMHRATRLVESKCQRRLAPFTAKFESHRAYGIAADEYGEQGDLPMDLTGALGWSQAAAMGVSDMVREFWLDECAPEYQELWTYSLTRVQILRTFGDYQTFEGNAFVTWEGPEADTGHVKMPIGTYCPIGSTIRVWYGGGYTVSIPDDLNLATVLQAVKLVLLGVEPEDRAGMSTADLDDQILELLTPYTRN